MKTLILARGLPGAGKTELVQILLDMDANVRAYSADDWLVKNGEYEWNRNDLAQAHDQCFASIEWDMSDGFEYILVHNTLTTEEEVEKYSSLAKKHGYRVVSLIVENRHNGVSVHQVPETTITKMRNRFSVKL